MRLTEQRLFNNRDNPNCNSKKSYSLFLRTFKKFFHYQENSQLFILTNPECVNQVIMFLVYLLARQWAESRTTDEITICNSRSSLASRFGITFPHKRKYSRDRIAKLELKPLKLKIDSFMMMFISDGNAAACDMVHHGSSWSIMAACDTVHVAWSIKFVFLIFTNFVPYSTNILVFSNNIQNTGLVAANTHDNCLSLIGNTSRR